MKPMKSLCAFVLATAMWAQVAQQPAGSIPNLPDETPIGTFEDGYVLTMGAFRQLFGALSPQQQQAVMRDRADFLHQYAMLRKLSKMGEEKKLAEQSPYKEALEQHRMELLSSAAINEMLNSFVIEPAEILKYYEANKNKYTEVKVKAIYIAYNDEAPKNYSTLKGKKPLTGAEAKAKAEKLLAQIRAGADFVKLAKENSDDEASRAKDGDFDTLHFGDNIPDSFRAVIFTMKPGETTEPLQQPNGYYLLRAEQVTVRTLAQTRDEIYNQLKDERFKAWMAKLNQETVVKVNPAFAPPK
jgi:parvulin-like peptidyl-prolyl isomerase